MSSSTVRTMPEELTTQGAPVTVSDDGKVGFFLAGRDYRSQYLDKALKSYRDDIQINSDFVGAVTREELKPNLTKSVNQLKSTYQTAKAAQGDSHLYTIRGEKIPIQGYNEKRATKHNARSALQNTQRYRQLLDEYKIRQLEGCKWKGPWFGRTTWTKWTQPKGMRTGCSMEEIHNLVLERGRQLAQGSRAGGGSRKRRVNKKSYTRRR